MDTWLANLSRSAKSKQNRRNRQPRPDWRSKLIALNFGVERLEDRVLLSITTETGATISPVENVAFSGPVATFTSPDNGPFTAVINWGDGSSTTVSGGSVTGGPSPAAFTINGSHTYADELAASNLVTTITDTSDSTTGTATGSATASEGDTLVAAVAPFTLSGTEGQTASLTATFTNTGANVSAASDFEAIVDWGDGTTNTLTGAAITGSATLTVASTHLYTDEGSFPVSVSLSDDSPGTANAFDSGTASIAESDTLAASGTSATISATQGAAFSTAPLATFTDTYTGNTAGDFTAAIDWGDGTTGAGVVSSASAGTLTVSGGHAYATTGAHQATVTLADDTPGTATATATATVDVGTAPSTAPSVSLTESGPAGVFTGAAITYTLTLANSSTTNPATNVAFVDELGPGETFFSASDTAGTNLTYNSATGEITGTVANIGTSKSDTVTIVALAATTGSVTNKSSIEIPSGNTGTPITASATTSVTAGSAPANLEVDIGEPVGTFFAGDLLSYAALVGIQAGTTAPSVVTVSFQLGSNEVLLSVSDTLGSKFTLANGVITATLNNFGGSGVDHITVLASPTKAGSLTANLVVATPNGNVGLTGDTGTTTIDPAGAGAANVSVTKAGPATAAVGGPVTYTVTLNNAGASAATSVAVGDLLGPNESLFSATDTAGTTFSLVNGEVTGQVASIPAGGTDTITIVVVPTAAGTLSNTAYTGILGGNQADNVSSPAVTTAVSAAPANAANLTVTKTGPASANEGDLVTYTVKVANSGGSATNVQFNDTLSDLIVYSVSDTAGTSFSVADGASGNSAVSGTIASIASGSSDTITIVAIPISNGTATDPISVAVPGGNAGSVTATPQSTTINTAPNTAANVSIAKNAPASVSRGDELSATVTLTNNSSSTPATNVAFVDSLPGQAFFSASDTDGTAFTYNPSTGLLTGTIASIAGGGTDTITIVTVPPTAGSVTDTAAIGITGGNQAFPASATATTTVTPIGPVLIPGVAVTKTGPATGTVGSPVTDTIKLTDDPTTNTPSTVKFVDTVGTNVSGVTASDGQTGDTFTYNATTGQVTGTVSAAAFAGATSGRGGTATVTVTFTPKAAGALTDTATIAIPGGNQGGPVTASVTTAVATPASLSISKVGSPSTISVGDTETYTITISNSGGTAATGAVVTDDVPAGLTNVQATDSAGTVTISGNAVTDDLGTVTANTGTETLTITGTAAALPSGTTSTTVSNTASLAFAGTTTPSDTVTTTISAGTPGTGVGFLAGQPGDGTPQTFVHNLYRELLGREPDSTGDSFWVAYVQQHNNAAGLSQAIQGFLNSQEYAIHYITTLYQVILGRAPDASGLQYWTAKMGSPGTPGGATGSADEKAVVAAFFGSDEFYIQSGNTAQGWINALYEDILGRPPDGSGAAFWAHELTTRGAGDRDGIVRDMLTTPEAAHLVLDSFYPAAGGTSSNPLPTPGSPAGTVATDLATITGDGWENLYLQGPYGSQQQGNDSFFNSLAGGASWDDVQLLLLETNQFYTNPNRPITH